MDMVYVYTNLDNGCIYGVFKDWREAVEILLWDAFEFDGVQLDREAVYEVASTRAHIPDHGYYIPYIWGDPELRTARTIYQTPLR